jgi:hypothetical protein
MIASALTVQNAWQTAAKKVHQRDHRVLAAPESAEANVRSPEAAASYVTRLLPDSVAVLEGTVTHSGKCQLK